MPTIQVNTDVMRQLGQVFVQLNDQLDHQMTPQIQNYIGQLESDWQGVVNYGMRSGTRAV